MGVFQEDIIKVAYEAEIGWLVHDNSNSGNDSKYREDDLQSGSKEMESRNVQLNDSSCDRSSDKQMHIAGQNSISKKN
ncbi:unnamed protein product [Ambrosiozyma monospora]|uniref:Unnamed protein product n=1 Tax=Ambrosiozyma monospora TaxID=43982 RepID=A0ACB5TQW3_AMBMO|nr:unnamed protein product [Ambrosiozyma monospora]